MTLLQQLQSRISSRSNTITYLEGVALYEKMDMNLSAYRREQALDKRIYGELLLLEDMKRELDDYSMEM